METNDYYKKIGYREYANLLFVPPLIFVNNEVVSIRKNIYTLLQNDIDKNIYYSLETDKNVEKTHNNHLTFTHLYINLYTKMGRFVLYIYKLPDDWYAVNFIHYYKCDQLDGLLKCINDLLSKIEGK